MDIFKDLPFELQTTIYGMYEKERKLDKIEEKQKKNHCEFLSEFKRYHVVFYNEAHDRWCRDLLFFTLRYEQRMSEGYPTFIM
jgi:hypothetical protein